MITMAVVASGDFGRLIGFTQGHGLAVVGVAVMLEAVGVAFAATLIADGFKIFVFRINDVVRGMAIGADGRAGVTLGEKLAVDAVLVGLLDAQMAFAAGFGDVGVIDWRIAVHGTFDVVDPVAIVAGGRDD